MHSFPGPQSMNLVAARRVGGVLALVLTLQGCATLDGQARAARTSGACARTAVSDIDSRAAGDKRSHCIGAARIAQRCSVAEATLASFAKEIRDFFGPGDADAADIRAGRTGIACAKAHGGPDELARCCDARGF
jgi:hypothetical protein